MGNDKLDAIYRFCCKSIEQFRITDVKCSLNGIDNNVYIINMSPDDIFYKNKEYSIAEYNFTCMFEEKFKGYRVLFLDMEEDVEGKLLFKKNKHCDTYLESFNNSICFLIKSCTKSVFKILKCRIKCLLNRIKYKMYRLLGKV